MIQLKQIPKKIYRPIRSRFTMKKIESLFWDPIGGKAVFLYRDCYETEWMSASKLGHRVKRPRS